MEMRELQATVLTKVVMNQDDPIVKAATDATQVNEDMGLGEENTQSFRQLCQEYASAEAMATVIHVCRVKKAFQKGKVKVFRSARLR